MYTRSVLLRPMDLFALRWAFSDITAITDKTVSSPRWTDRPCLSLSPCVLLARRLALYLFSFTDQSVDNPASE